MVKASLRKPGLFLAPKPQEREKMDIPERAIDQLIGLDKPKPRTQEPQVEDKSKKEAGGAIEKRIPGKTLQGKRVVVPAEETTLFTGNPRNYETDHELLAELRESVRAVGGNTQAVDGRIVEGKIQVIAGSQRRTACIEENVPLIVDVYEGVTDDDAHFIAHVENHARNDISPVAQCKYFNARYKELQQEGNEKVERFAARYKLSYSTMRDYLSFGALPDELLSLVANQKSWRFKSLKKLRKVWSKVARETLFTAQEAAEKVLNQRAGKTKFKDPKELLKALEALLPDGLPEPPPKHERIDTRAFVVDIKRNPNGFSLNVSAKNKEDIKRIEERVKLLLENLEI